MQKEAPAEAVVAIKSMNSKIYNKLLIQRYPTPEFSYARLRNRHASQRELSRTLSRSLRQVLARSLSLVIGICFCGTALSSVLPEDRADVLYHSYDGGGVSINGPSVLVRKGFKKKYSASANYYVDKVSSASIDVLTTASEYTEERTEYSLGLDYLDNKTTLSTGYGRSTENDYDAQTVFFNLSQDFFGDLTTLSLGYSQGSDVVTQTGNDDFSEKVNRKNYKLSLTQILTQNFIANVSYETITDQGYLNNPYRLVRFRDPDPDREGAHVFEQERYPSTRTSDAVSVRGIYYLPYRAALKAEYRYYADSWAIKADTFGIEYRHPFKEHWLAEFRVRQYSQTGADFFSDLFERGNSQAFLARDKELSDFDSLTLGATISYELKFKHQKILERMAVTFAYDRINFDYDEFREIDPDTQNTDAAISGTEPFYSFSANVIRFYVSAWY